MTASGPQDPFARLRKIVVGALALPPEQRDAYLDEACEGDGSLRQEAEALLAYDENPASMLDKGAVLAGAIQDKAADRAGARAHPIQVGPYRIEESLGEGGMGSVYRAVQESPIRREVALKLIRRGLDSAGVIARFESERRTLARLNHPNIAKVLDAGEDESGHPYFVMELVRGVSITDWVREQKLGIRERVRILLQVVQAIRHAHRHGIIHRDLKPGNILLTVVQGKPIPKVIDFGIAKAIEETEAAAGFQTRTGELLGTPEFMSPEQVRGDIEAIDVRSDVYALGVLAYELLTGEAPLALRGLPLHEIVQRICEDSPRTMRSVSGVSGRRIGTDLDTIVRKCLEKDPDRRYSGAAELADDLERWLDAKPIHAHPPSTLYQFRKFVARNRSFAFVAGLSVLFLILYGLTVSFQLDRQTRERQRAEAEARKAQRISEVLQGILGSSQVDAEGPAVTVLDALDLARREVATSLADEPEVRADLLRTIGVSYRSVGDYSSSDSLLTEARDLLVAAVGPRHHDVLLIRSEIANTLFFEGNWAEAEKEIRETIEIGSEDDLLEPAEIANMLSTLALSLRRLGPVRMAEAESTMLRALEIQRRIVADDPDDELVRNQFATSLENLAATLYPQGRFAEAEALVRETLEIKQNQDPSSSGTATSLHNLAFLLQIQGKAEEAEPIFREALALDIDLMCAADKILKTRTSLAHCLIELGKYADAESLLTQSIARYCESENMQEQRLSSPLLGLSRVSFEMGNFIQAADRSRESLRIARDAGESGSQRVPLALIALAKAQGAMGDFGPAELNYSDAITIQCELLGTDHLRTARSRKGLAALLLDAGHPEKARPFALASAAVLLESPHGKPAELDELRQLAEDLEITDQIVGLDSSSHDER